jgi:hypothetical protein
LVPQEVAEYPANADKLNMAEEPVRFTATGLAAKQFMPRKMIAARHRAGAILVICFFISVFLLAQVCAAMGEHPV